MSKKSRKYWRKRAIDFEEEWMNRCKETIEKRLATYYKKSLSEIQKDISALYATFMRDNSIDFKTAQALIRGKEYQEWRMTLEEYVKSIGKGDKGLERELNTLAMRSRINRLDKLYGETLQELDKLGRNVTDDMRSFLSDAYKENYSRDIFDLVKVGGLSVAISKVEKIAAEKILAARWSGKNFSKRIWDNTRLLSGVLRETITTGVHRGLSIPKLSQMIEGKMNAGYKNAVRLVRTEMNFVNNQAHADSMAAAEIAAYEFIATLDNRTSAPCRSRDGETFLLSEKTVGFNYPPLHPRCRSTVAPFIEEMGRGGTRIAKVGKKNIEIPAAMNYKDYEKVYVKKELSLAEWNNNHKNGERIQTNLKVNFEQFGFSSKNAPYGLAASDKVKSAVSGGSPIFMGSIASKELIRPTLEFFENQIVTREVENAIIITAENEIYHCVGNKNNIDSIEELGDKLKGACVTHNHPVGSVSEHSFSGLDWSFFERYNLKILRGIEEKFVYELNRNKADSNLSDLILDGDLDLHGGHNTILIKALNAGYGYRRWRRG